MRNEKCQIISNDEWRIIALMLDAIEQLLLVQIVEADKLPSGLRAGKGKNHDFITTFVGTRKRKIFRVRRILFGLFFGEALRSICLLVENLSIAAHQLGSCFDAGFAIGHGDGKPGHAGYRLLITLDDGGLKLLPKECEAFVGLRCASINGKHGHADQQ